MTYSSVGLGDTFGDNVDVTLLMASVSAILTLIARSVEKEVAAKGA